MAKYTGWKKKYSYLNDYKPGMDGKYVYYGRHYVLEDSGLDIKKLKWTMGIADILLIALFIIGGCMDAGAIWSQWYVIIPYALEAVGIFLLIWKNLSLVTEKYPVKEYIYKKTVTWFKPTSVITIIACAISLITTVICMISYSEYIKLTGCILYLVIKVLMAFLCVMFIKVVCNKKWQLDPSEELEQ